METIYADSELGERIGSFRVGFTGSGNAAAALGNESIPLKPTARTVFFHTHSPGNVDRIEERVIAYPAQDDHTRYRYDGIFVADGVWYLQSAQLLHWTSPGAESEACSFHRELTPTIWPLGPDEPTELLELLRAGDTLPEIGPKVSRGFLIGASVLVAIALVGGGVAWLLFR